MKRSTKLSMIITALAYFLSPIDSSIAAPNTCKSLNEVRTISGKENACTRVAGKLVWKLSKVGIQEFGLSGVDLIPNGFQIGIDNYDGELKWVGSTDSGLVEINELGLVSVTGFLHPSDSLTVKLFKGKYFRAVTYKGEGFTLKTIDAPVFANSMFLTSDGFKVSILNFDESLEWSLNPSEGSAYIESDGYLVVEGVENSETLTINAEISGPGYRTISKKYTYAMPARSLAPKVAPASNLTTSSFEAKIENYDSRITWTVKSSAGQAIISSSGVILVSGLQSGQTTTVKVTASETDKRVTSTEFTVTTSLVFSNITEREWALIAKDPGGSIGKTIVIYGYITQFDAATGLTQFRADVNGLNTRTSYGFNGDNTFLSGTATQLQNFVGKDYFVAKVVVNGTKTYTTTLNGSITVPSLLIYEISRL